MDLQPVFSKNHRKLRGQNYPLKTVPKNRKPDDMTLEEWQIAIRQEFSREQPFRIRNCGDSPVYSEYSVLNRNTNGDYRVMVRGEFPGDNNCNCPDFSVNTLGTCKHIEAVLTRIRKQRSGRTELQAGFHPEVSELFLRYGGKREIIFRAAKDFPSKLQPLTSTFFEGSGVMKLGAELRIADFLNAMKEANQEVRCSDDVYNFVARKSDLKSLAAKVERAFPKGIHSARWKELLKAPLYPYQREGALFAARVGRVLIADEMGLGKTIQAIAASEILASLGLVERVLIITPTSLKHQWKQEIGKFSVRSAEIVEGLLETRAAKYQTESFYKITNYDVIHRDQSLIENWSPDLIVLDEAQRIKNWKTRTARSVKRLASPYAIVLTGTPLENRLEELHSIVEFVDRFRLGPAFRYLATHEIHDDNGKVVGYQNLSSVKETLKPILVRRKKEEVLKDLPQRLEKKYFVPMTVQQAQHHEENREIVAKLVRKWRRFKFLSESDQLFLRIALQRMRMSCNSTYLIDKKTDFGVKADEVITTLSDILEEKDAKVVIFSQWVGTHEIIIRRLQANKIGYVFFHGSVPGKQRGGLISKFKEDPNCRIFLSTDAGGVGLNLQNASAVINMDQPWNPAILEQRIGRVHRLGQTKPVRVIHFISQGTIEQGMLDLLSFKKSMFAGVLDDGENVIHLGKSKMNLFMETVEKATIAIPEAMPKQVVAAASVEGEKRNPVDPESGMGIKDAAWSEIAQLGTSLFEKLGAALASKEPYQKTSPFITTDDEGKPFLRIPLPERDTLQKMLSGFAKLIQG